MKTTIILECLHGYHGDDYIITSTHSQKKLNIQTPSYTFVFYNSVIAMCTIVYGYYCEFLAYIFGHLLKFRTSPPDFFQEWAIAILPAKLICALRGYYIGYKASETQLDVACVNLPSVYWSSLCKFTISLLVKIVLFSLLFELCCPFKLTATEV